jgi:hypothetical protein
MRIASLTLAAATLALAGLAAPAHADPHSDFIFEIKSARGSAVPPWVVDKYVKLNVGKACMEKLADKKNGGVHMALAFASAIERWATKLTGDDWEHIESQNSDKEKNRALVEPMMNDFGKRFSLVVNVEGDDCDAGMSALWLKYWAHVGYDLEKHPPKADKVAIVLDVKAKERKLIVETGKDGATFHITAPRDIEPVWADDLEKAFTKVERPKK